jgi:hypothetical protein
MIAAPDTSGARKVNIGIEFVPLLRRPRLQLVAAGVERDCKLQA